MKKIKILLIILGVFLLSGCNIINEEYVKEGY